MSIAEIQEKVGHKPQTAINSGDSFQMPKGVLAQSAMIYKNHGKSDEETAAMLKNDFMLNEQQAQIILDEIKGRA